MGIAQNLDGLVGKLWLLIADSNPEWKIVLIVQMMIWAMGIHE